MNNVNNVNNVNKLDCNTCLKMYAHCVLCTRLYARNLRDFIGKVFRYGEDFKNSHTLLALQIKLGMSALRSLTLTYVIQFLTPLVFSNIITN